MIDKLNFYNWTNSSSGYGIVALEYATALERLTHGVSIGWERREDILEEHFNQLNDEQKALLAKPFVKEKVGIIKTTPQMFFHNESEFRIGYTMVENTKIGEKWVNYCNEMDAMLVPCEFLVNVFKDCGVTKPIRAVKQGINSAKFPYFKRERKAKFIFGTIGYMDDRKNWKDLVQAFYSEFDQFEPVELWIKNTNRYFEHFNFSDPRIKVINETYTFEQIQKLYTLIDCFVAPSHAEGSGLTPRESMAAGCPTILSNWSGHTEICNPEFNYPLTPIAIDYPDVRGNEQPGFMARFDVSELMYYMREVYTNYDKALEKGKLASDFIHKEYNWDSCAKDLLQKVEELL
jgi:glycosyltransferase involved in cell wall biosynthesis